MAYGVSRFEGFNREFGKYVPALKESTEYMFMYMSLFTGPTGGFASFSHYKSLKRYGVSPYAVYHPTVVREVYKQGKGFNQNWLDYWGIKF